MSSKRRKVDFTRYDASNAMSRKGPVIKRSSGSKIMLVAARGAVRDLPHVLAPRIDPLEAQEAQRTRGPGEHSRGPGEAFTRQLMRPDHAGVC
jgi:hypothetical protein